MIEKTAPDRRVVTYKAQETTVETIARTVVAALDEHAHGKDPGPLTLIYSNYSP